MAAEINEKSTSNESILTVAENIMHNEKYDVVLVAKGDKYMEVLNTVKKMMNLTVSEAMSIVKNIPAVVATGVSGIQAVGIRGMLKNAGAKGEIIVSNKSTKSRSTSKKESSVASKVGELSVNGNKKIETLKIEFNEIFPYLSIRICYPYAKDVWEEDGICYEVENDHTIADVRRVGTGAKKDISIAGNKKIKTLEREFEEVLGLFVKVCYQETVDCSYPVHGEGLEYTLASYNALCEQRGCKRGYWM